ncbi:MAG: tRNA pseudouridine(38-40) synthase TruA [Oscillospiraceae bacterium]|nr:tRNA pseudouridine(38-40) synthase TruA [Oscillospiraceae bacterium]
MRTLALRLRYDGSRFHGWQVQKTKRAERPLPTVCGEVERGLAKILKSPVSVVGCGRTDAGVHAERYCASFRTEGTIPAERLPYALNTVLPPEIAAVDAADAPDDFNAILSCVKKEYTYRVICSRLRDPFLANRVHYYGQTPDLAAMRTAAQAFVGTHDFAAVRNVGTMTKTTVRTVHWFESEMDGDALTFRVCADGFLYNMVRAMVGTLLYVSEGKLAAEEIPRLLELGDRRLTGPTVPPHGLYLSRIWYDGEVGEMMAR